MAAGVQVFQPIDGVWCARCDCCDDYWYYDMWAGAVRGAEIHVAWHQARYCPACRRY